MKKIRHRYLFLFALFGLMLFSRSAVAEEKTVERTQRKGFLIGFDVGGGGLHLNGRNAGAILSAFKIGGGLNEKILLMFEGAGADDVGRDSSGLVSDLFSAQFFLSPHLYVRPGIGMGLEYEDLPSGTSETHVGFSSALAAGYEWRLTKKFALSPELKLGYSRINGRNHESYGAVADLRWYF